MFIYFIYSNCLTNDFIYVGLYLYKDILAVLSVQHQTIHIFQILDGMFINVRTIGRYHLYKKTFFVLNLF